MGLVNKSLLPHERAKVLRSVGLKINKDSGQISNIKNVGYKDTNPSLCINLDTGTVKDFGNEGDAYSGDVFTLVGAILGMDFKETLKYFEDTLNSDFKNESRKIEDSKYKGMSTEEIKYKEAEGYKFWNKEYSKKLRKCQKVLNDFAPHEELKDVHSYDCIPIDTLKKFGCGYYGFGDFNFGLSDKEKYKELFLAIPYKTGCMLYKRKDKDKVIRMVSGSKASYSFFNGTTEFNHDTLIINKSPREAMLSDAYFGFFCNVIGVNSGESISLLYPEQVKTLERFSNRDTKHKKNIYIFFDCDEDESFEKAFNFANLVKEIIKDSCNVCITNWYKNTSKKDITDVIRDGLHKEDVNLLTRTIAKSTQV